MKFIKYNGAAHLGTGVGDTDIAPRVTLLSQFTGEEFVDFCTEDTVRDELALLADLCGHFLKGIHSQSSVPVSSKRADGNPSVSTDFCQTFGEHLVETTS